MVALEFPCVVLMILFDGLVEGSDVLCAFLEGFIFQVDSAFVGDECADDEEGDHPNGQVDRTIHFILLLLAYLHKQQCDR